MTERQRLLYGRWQRPRSAGLFGLTFGTTLIALVSIVAAMIALMAVGLPYGLVVAAVLIVVNLPLVWSHDGRSGWERGIEMWQWRKAGKRGERLYRGGRFSIIPGGGARLPGILASSKMFEDEAAGGHRFGMIHLPAKEHYSIVLSARAQGGEAVPQTVVDRWVSGWGQAIATIGQASDIAGISATVETLPTTGQELRAEVHRLKDTHRLPPQLVADVMVETTQMSQAATNLLGRIAITFKAEASRRKSPADQSAEIARRLPTILNHLDAAGVPSRPMTASEISGMMRRSYSIGDYADIEMCDIKGTDHGIQWHQVGPLGCKEESDRYLHDGAVSVTWEMDIAPAGAVDERVLTALLAPSGDAPYKRVTLVYRPLDAAVAVKTSEDDYKNALVANATQRGVGSAAAALRVEAASASRTEQARGAALVPFGLLVTVTAPETADLPRVATLTRGLGESARLALRRCYRFQAAAFAGSTGVGLLLPEHESISDTLAG